jgi:hypothetical protein
MSDALALFLLIVALVSAAVVWIPKFSMPLSREVGMSLCALGLIPVADAIRGARPVGPYPTIMILVGLALILLSYRRTRVVRNTSEPRGVDAGDLHKVSGGRKS